MQYKEAKPYASVLYVLAVSRLVLLWKEIFNVAIENPANLKRSLFLWQVTCQLAVLQRAQARALMEPKAEKATVQR